MSTNFTNILAYSEKKQYLCSGKGEGLMTGSLLLSCSKERRNMNIYRHRYSITAADMDIHYRMTANAVLLYYQDCWARYMSTLHMAAFDLVHQNKLWVISEFNAHWEQEEAYWSQEIEVSVWNGELTGLRLYADFRISRADGKEIASGYGCWTLLDSETHRPVIISNILDVNTLSIANGEKHPKIRIAEGVTVLHEAEHRVNPINLDFNGHVNNRTYLNIAMQTVPKDFAGTRRLSSLTIRWLHETFLGDQLICRMYSASQDNTYLHTISKDDVQVAQIYSELHERTSERIIDDEAPRS